MGDLGNKFSIIQELEIVEVFTRFETANKYNVLDESGNKVFYAYEDDTGFIGKQFLKSRRSLKLHILDENQKELFVVDRPFFFMKSKANIFMGNEKTGKVKQTKAIGNKKFDFISNEGRVIFSCVSKLPHLWTFKVMKDGYHIATILKKWRGGQEVISDADMFDVEFHYQLDDSMKISILICAFIIDLRVFES